VAAVCDRLPWISAKGAKLLAPRDRIHKIVTNGAGADEIVKVLEGLAAAVDEGREPVAHWNAQYVFSGHYDALRTKFANGDAGGLTAEQAAAYVAQHRKAPDGWRFDEFRRLVPDEVQP
jgi:hypothetical protein